jgi:hypothetical protein
LVVHAATLELRDPGTEALALPQLRGFMPIIMNIDHGRREINGIALGPLTYTDIENHLLMERHFGGLAYKELIDARGAGIALTSAEIQRIVALVRSMAQKSRLGPTAVVVSTDFAFGVMSLLQALLEDVGEMRPFWSEEEARGWLAAK